MHGIPDWFYWLMMVIWYLPIWLPAVIAVTAVWMWRRKRKS